MGLFSRLAGSIWNGIKRATTFVYERAIRSAVRAVGRFFGVSVERVDRALATVEAVVAKVVGVLETDLSPVLKAWLDALQARFERWAIAHLGAVGVLLVQMIEQLERSLRRDREPVVVVDITHHHGDWEN